MTLPRFTIYCHTNRVNGKRYVGQTVYSMEKRWADHVSNAKSGKRTHVLARAIRKHGVNAFDHEVLEVVSTQEAADAAESKWIEQLTCRVPNGYNLKSGGRRHGHHEDTKRLIGKSSRAQWQKMTEEERAAIGRVMSEAAYIRWANDQGKSRHRVSERLRTWWQGMTAEERFTQQRARQNTIAPEQRSTTIAKSWETRRIKYGLAGSLKSSEEWSASIKKGWADMPLKARAERVQKVKDGRRRAREARASRFVRINLLPTESRVP
jgi:group I intron endonuclease